jgi:hypothetical protein
MCLRRPLNLMALIVVGIYGCGGEAFQGREDDVVGTSGKTSSAGTSATSGGRSASDAGAGGDDEPGSAGETANEGGAGAATNGGSSSSGGGPSLGGAGGGSTAGVSTGGSVPAMGGASTGGGNGGPLRIADLEAIYAGNLTGFNSAGFRCKSLSVCGVNQGCIYYSGFLGSVQSKDDPYSDGDELNEAQAVKIRIAGGAQSMCSSVEVAITQGETLKLTHDGQHSLLVYFPSFTGAELTLYVANDGSTYTDAALTKPAMAP